MKKIKIGLISCAALVLIMCVPCYARSTDDYLKEITEINEQAKNVTIQVNVPEDFDQRVDVYLNKEAHGITAGDGYSITIPVDAGTYAIHVILPKDAMEQYVATAQEALNVRTDTTLIVNVSANPDYGKNSDGRWKNRTVRRQMKCMRILNWKMSRPYTIIQMAKRAAQSISRQKITGSLKA